MALPALLADGVQRLRSDADAGHEGADHARHPDACQLGWHRRPHHLPRPLPLPRHRRRRDGRLRGCTRLDELQPRVLPAPASADPASPRRMGGRLPARPGAQHTEAQPPQPRTGRLAGPHAPPKVAFAFPVSLAGAGAPAAASGQREPQRVAPPSGGTRAAIRQPHRIDAARQPRGPRAPRLDGACGHPDHAAEARQAAGRGPEEGPPLEVVCARYGRRGSCFRY